MIERKEQVKIITKSINSGVLYNRGDRWFDDHWAVYGDSDVTIPEKFIYSEHARCISKPEWNDQYRDVNRLQFETCVARLNQLGIPHKIETFTELEERRMAYEDWEVTMIFKTVTIILSNERLSKCFFAEI